MQHNNVGNPRLLVVDDNPDSGETLGLLLRTTGREVQVVESGAQALASVAIECPDAVVLDVGMPGMNGYELAQRLRRRGFAGLLIALTGYGRDQDRQRAVESGIDHYLVKPVDFPQLEELLRSTAKRPAVC
jgi:CheY-like chemotaxis protein